MSTESVQVQFDAQGFEDFTLEHPGPITASVEVRYREALLSGWSPDDLIAAARAYRRLVDAQDAEPLPAHEWLVAMLGEVEHTEQVSEAAAFSAAVRALRAVQGISQAELASRAHVGGRTLAQIEAQPDEHRTRHANRLAVADALGWSVDDMVDLGYRVLGR